MTTTNKTIHIDDGIAERVQEAGDRLGELKDEMAKRVDTLGSVMKQHPFAALGIGLGIGYLIARLIHR